MPVYNALLILCWAAFILVWSASAIAGPRMAPGVYRGIAIAIAVVAVILAVVSATGLHRGWLTPAPHPFIGAAGVAFAAAGIALAIWARVHLGRNWAMPMVDRQDTELVTSGPYARVRHPIYAGVLLALLGSALVAGPWWLFVFLAGAGYFIYSARHEDEAMAERFPTAFSDYRRRTKMLVPFVL